MNISNNIKFLNQNNKTYSSNKINSACCNNRNLSENNINFKGKTTNILLKLFRFKVGEGYTTKGHLQNVYYDFNLNDMLRNSKAALLDSMSMLNVHSIGHNLFTPTLTLRKDVISESPQRMKTRLNSEFKILKPTRKAMTLYRGLSQLPDEIYQKFLSYKKGAIVIPDKGFAYLTDKKSTALGYAKRYDTCTTPVILNVEIPKGSQMSQLNAIVPRTKNNILPSIIDEKVVPAESQYEVIKDSFIDKDGVLQVFLKYLNKW